MGTEIKVWQVSEGHLIEIEEDDLAADYVEKDLEEWIANDTSLLGSKLLVIGRQYDIPSVGCLDLLCIDEAATLVVVEFKRDLTRRETIAQILDYASWLDAASEEEIEACAQKRLGKPLAEAFVDFFGNELQSLTPQNHRMLVVAPTLDLSAERIINYLAERHGIKINAIFFRYAKTSHEDAILIRTVLVPEPIRGANRATITTADLLKLADEKKVRPLVEICRRLGTLTTEMPSSTYGGSFRYFKRRLIVGINIAGEKGDPAPGELGVWIPVYKLPEVIPIPEQEIRDSLKAQFGAADSGKTECTLSLKTPEQAEALVSLIQKWLAAAPDEGT